MIATSQRYSELHPEVTIQWEKRSLQEFADAPIQSLVGRYDLLVIDHPWAGYAAQSRALPPLNEHLPEGFLQDQAAHSVGQSHDSYRFDGRQTALAIDAAAPVASWRADVLERKGLDVPRDWEGPLKLAKKGLVVFPAISIDSLMNFYMFCLAHGEDPFTDGEKVVSEPAGRAALESLRELAALCRPEIFQWNPIKVYEAMAAAGDDIGYCPFAYGYSNYAREGYAPHLLTFGDLITFGGRGGRGRLRSTLGGTGLAVSSACRHKAEALSYVQYAASSGIQRTLYTESGGQPGHRSAWTDAETNRRTGGYFAGTPPALDRAYVRPRYSGYLHFQDRAGDFVRGYMMHGGDPARVLGELDRLYRESLITAKGNAHERSKV
ncbi:extracellular solute-binding protein [Paenibacillus sp. P26]|nr:extracellular solute-binding protein [Paenibacillus sp. P26]